VKKGRDEIYGGMRGGRTDPTTTTARRTAYQTTKNHPVCVCVVFIYGNFIFHGVFIYFLWRIYTFCKNCFVIQIAICLKNFPCLLLFFYIIFSSREFLSDVIAFEAIPEASVRERDV